MPTFRRWMTHRRTAGQESSTSSTPTGGQVPPRRQTTFTVSALTHPWRAITRPSRAQRFPFPHQEAFETPMHSETATCARGSRRPFATTIAKLAGELTGRRAWSSSGPRLTLAQLPVGRKVQVSAHLGTIHAPKQDQKRTRRTHTPTKTPMYHHQTLQSEQITHCLQKALSRTLPIN